MHPSRGVSLLLFVALMSSCAGPNQLARQSERALKAGDLVKAYELARRGVEKDPKNRAARAAIAAVAAQRVDQGNARVIELAAVDAARFALEFRDFRAELARYVVVVPDDPRYLERENAILDAAAAREYWLGERGLAAQQPKNAYAHYRAAESFVASYRDLQEKLRRAHHLGTTRVALMPFEDDVHVPGLSRALCDQLYRRLASRLSPDGFVFTELVSPDEVYATMTVKELQSLPAESMWRIASGVDAARVVTGRVHGLRSNTNTLSFEYPIYRKVAERDTSGKAIVRWVETRFDAVARERRLSVDLDVHVLDARTHAELAGKSQTFESVARVAWTDFRADGSCDDYRLTASDHEDEEERRRIDERWKECFGTWTLPEMLEQARNDRRRSIYDARFRDEFKKDSRRRPILCGELPGETDMTVIALDDVWRPVLKTLKTLDSKD